MNGLIGGTKYVRETPKIPSVSEPIPEARPLRERKVEEAAVDVSGRPKLAMLISLLRERGPLDSTEVAALTGTVGTNLHRMVDGTAVRETKARCGATSKRWVYLDGQEEELQKRILLSQSGTTELPQLRIARWDDGSMHLIRGSAKIELTLDEVQRFIRMAG